MDTEEVVIEEVEDNMKKEMDIKEILAKMEVEVEIDLMEMIIIKVVHIKE